jgi:hypothetical protein
VGEEDHFPGNVLGNTRPGTVRRTFLSGFQQLFAAFSPDERISGSGPGDLSKDYFDL